jgi:ATP-dependent RNA helicase RhlE
MSFSDFALIPELEKAIVAEGYTTPTPIQTLTIPLVRDGHDVVACAQTGTGKTAAFALPMIQRIRDQKKNKGPAGPKQGNFRTPTVSAVVMVPTRELATQVAASFGKLGQFAGVRSFAIFGGVSHRPQITALRRGVDVLIATPGRLLDLVRQHAVKLSEVRTLVLDEADQMLDMGFIDDLRRIVSFIPKERQTLMFSATMPDSIRKLTTEWLNDPTSVAVPTESTTPEKLVQAVYYVETSEKREALVQLLRSQPQDARTLVFCRTKRGVDKVMQFLQDSRINALAIHGNKSQNARNIALEAFRSGQNNVLVATDVASRGLHISNIATVVNFELPDTPESYVHRIGRTARANAAGSSITFCSSQERHKLRMIERLTRQPVMEVRLPGDEDKPISREAKPRHPKRGPFPPRRKSYPRRRAAAC